jgi:flavin-dependent dehydrogenase
MPNSDRPIVIAGAGPAGSSLAMRLAALGLPVTLIERYRFPREKLCGEFISPECLSHFGRLGVLDEMLDAGGERIYRTDFFETGGRSISVPSRWFGRGFALSLSRARMDTILLRAAKARGVDVLDETSVVAAAVENGSVVGVRIRDASSCEREIEASTVVDATGRARVVTKMAEGRGRLEVKPRFVGFKAHLDGARPAGGVCEIYGFKGGYAGLSLIEDGMANLCVLTRSSLAKGKAEIEAAFDQLKRQNKRARKTLESAAKMHNWLAVSINSFGIQAQPGISGLYTVGDSAAFVDPFTGSGMLMAMESSALFADLIGRLGAENESLKSAYYDAHKRRFSPRLRVSGLVRRVAYEPRWSSTAVRLLARSRGLSRVLAQKTRSHGAEIGS